MLPISELRQLVDQGEPVVLGALANEQFYQGVHEMITLVNGIKGGYQLYSNGEVIDNTFLEGIVDQVNNISLSDIR